MGDFNSHWLITRICYPLFYRFILVDT
jgi:hypothetical protein